MQNSVDAVITWVDGNDPLHKIKFNNYFQSLSTLEHTILNEEAWHPTRFQQCDEIKYCLLSIQKFAPWIKRIFLVTDNQAPNFLNTLSKDLLDKIKLIDHKEIFYNYAENLPTFNSLSIETMLWRIPKLSEKFIYFNDDCFLVRPVTYEDFFYNNKIIIRGTWKTKAHAKWLAKTPLKYFLSTIHVHRKLQEHSAELAGFHNKFIHLEHAPFANCKTSYKNYFKDWQIAENSSYKIRHENQFWPISLIYHILMQHDLIILDKSSTCITINGAHQNANKIIKKLNIATKDTKVRFLCVQSLDITPELLRDYIYKWLENMLHNT